MFSVCYVILPFSETAPAEAIRSSLAPFQRGGRDELPADRLAFQDETDWVIRLHEGRFVFTASGRGGLRIEGGDHGWIGPLDIRAVRAEMARRGLTRWEVRFADVEPNLDGFFDRFVRDLERHPGTGRYGRWLNPLGQWDWWDLGGRFDGRIGGDRRQHGRTASGISSGPNPGRSILANIEDAVARALASGPPAAVDVRADDNIEMVSRLLEEARAGRTHAFPGAVLLPPGSVEDRRRWLDSWPAIGPPDALSWLGLPPDAGWEEVVIRAYQRFPEHWAAGVAYHH
ncbi:hypothetical protein [Microvirga massiliensis]|uniref:hypothetical protein n=1 Tax=Microvirga massiliensis TaxID=1033741 RepID=UPI00062B56F9|nr:hypothetical protein [Microvirga massiliensis]